MKTLLLIAAALGTHAVAQGEWTDPELEKVGTMLSGAWRTTAPVAQTDGDTAAIAMVVTPVSIEGVDNAMYVEQSRADLMVMPYRA
ncbi:MAG: hypothetical protein KDA28_16725, partial [Phycisphaerales bacterium]|nr:hypothetical protein [Phycisphaerales bacterium]